VWGKTWIFKYSPVSFSFSITEDNSPLLSLQRLTCLNPVFCVLNAVLRLTQSTFVPQAARFVQVKRNDYNYSVCTDGLTLRESWEERRISSIYYIIFPPHYFFPTWCRHSFKLGFSQLDVWGTSLQVNPGWKKLILYRENGKKFKLRSGLPLVATALT